MEQPELFPATSEADKAFWKFHKENPEVFNLLVKLTREARGAGHKHIGIKMLIEVVRWKSMLKTKSEDGYKINNNFAPRYARIIEDEYPEFREMFNKRRIRT